MLALVGFAADFSQTSSDPRLRYQTSFLWTTAATKRVQTHITGEVMIRQQVGGRWTVWHKLKMDGLPPLPPLCTPKGTCTWKMKVLLNFPWFLLSKYIKWAREWNFNSERSTLPNWKKINANTALYLTAHFIYLLEQTARELGETMATISLLSKGHYCKIVAPRG